MPVTRRSPYVGLVLWPGGKVNAHFESPGDLVTLADADYGGDRAAFDKVWSATVEGVGKLLDPGMAVTLRAVTFCVP